MGTETRYVFDKVTGTVKKATLTVWRPARALLRVFLVSVALTVVAYSVFAIFISTDKERILREQNRKYAEAYPELSGNSRLLTDVIAGLQHRDNAVYESIFHSDAPALDPMASLDFLFGSDTIPDHKIVAYTYRKVNALASDVDTVEAAFRDIILRLADKDVVNPPMGLPLGSLSFAQVGASTGLRMSPFLKARVEHNGLDLIVPQGEPVLAAADGVVSEVVHSQKGQGNVVTITHKGGYETRYAHLGAISVSKGQSVKAGKTVGTVGMSGNSFIPHLHYEVLKDGVYLDPVKFIAPDVPAQEYANMIYMAVNTEQSMD